MRTHTETHTYRGTHTHSGAHSAHTRALGGERKAPGMWALRPARAFASYAYPVQEEQIKRVCTGTDYIP